MKMKEVLCVFGVFATMHLVKCSNIPVYSSYSVTNNDVLDDSDSVYNKGSSFYNYYENLKEEKLAANAAANLDISSNAGSCTSDRLVVYKAVLHTYWSRELFPKHYPDWRPTAQWTKTIGRTHDNTFALYHLGQRATDGVKQFAETGKSDILENFSSKPRKQSSSTSASAKLKSSPTSSQQQQNDLDKSTGNNDDSSKWNKRNPIYDDFTLPAITTGSGRSESKFFVDGNHSHVSLMTKILPSPDWFIGVDSFQLCAGGTWLDTVTVEMDPLDAGTDNGFTFTAPNWPTVPQGVIYRITSRYPAHPAGSFFYPKSKRLPPIATFQFIKLKEYELSEVFNISEDDRKYETVKTQTRLESEHNHVEMNNELSASIEKERQNEVTEGPVLTTEKDRIRARLLEKINSLSNQTEVHQSTATNNNKNFVRKNDKSAILQNIANNYKYNKKYHRKKISSMSSSSSSTVLQQEQQDQQRRQRPHRRDCRVSHWSEWSDCNKTCGIGEMHRYRRIIKHPKRGGRSCPPLKESKWCGTGMGCPVNENNNGDTESKEQLQQQENYINW